MIDNKGHINWEMAARLLAGEADEIDRGLLNRWLVQNEANREEWARISAVWNQGGEALLLEGIDGDVAWEKVRDHTLLMAPEPVGSHRVRYLVMGMAAMLVVAFGLWWLFLAPSPQYSSSMVVTSLEKEEVVLSDGSTVTLNAGSKFSCVQPFKARERKVELHGEGFFKVEGNKDWPFLVETGGLTVKVTGTGFNVRAYPHLDMVEVVVVEGRVEVMASDASSGSVVLKAGQMALFQRQKGVLRVQETSDPNLLAWITRQLQFQETSLDRVFETLERVYRVNIQLADESINAEKLTAQFSDNSLDFVLNVVCMTFNLKMEREGENILLTRK